LNFDSNANLIRDEEKKSRKKKEKRTGNKISNSKFQFKITVNMGDRQGYWQCLCEFGTKKWYSQKEFRNHCSAPSKCSASNSSHYFEELSVAQHTRGRQDTAVYASKMTDALTDEFTKMRFTENIPHRAVDNARDLTHRIQVASLDCVVDLFEGKLDDENKAYLKGIVEALKDVASHENFGTAHARNTKSKEKFKPTHVNMCRSYAKENGEWVCIADIPIDEALERMLQNKETCDAAFIPHTHVEGVYSDIRDGSLFREHVIFKNDLFAFCFMLYADDFELLNPIGQCKGVQKLTVFYWQLVNLHPSKRVLRHNIQIACVVLAKTISEKHMPFIVGGDLDNEKCSSIGGSLRRMNKGVVMTLPGQGLPRLYYGAFLCFCGDFISSAQVSGTKESPASAHRFCRTCMCVHGENSVDVIDFCGQVPHAARLRTQKENIEHVALVNDALATTKAKTKASIEYGVNPWGAAFQEPFVPHGTGIEAAPQDIAHNELAGNFVGHLHLAFKKFFKSKTHRKFTR